MSRFMTWSNLHFFPIFSLMLGATLYHPACPVERHSSTKSAICFLWKAYYYELKRTMLPKVVTPSWSHLYPMRSQYMSVKAWTLFSNWEKYSSCKDHRGWLRPCDCSTFSFYNQCYFLPFCLKC